MGHLQRLIIIAVAVALWRGDVAILVVLVLDRPAFRFFSLVVVLLRRLALRTVSAHIAPFSPDRTALMYRNGAFTSIRPVFSGILASAAPIYLSNFLSNFLALFADIDQTGRNMEQI